MTVDTALALKMNEHLMRGLFQAVLRIGDTGVSEEAGALHLYVLL